VPLGVTGPRRIGPARLAQEEGRVVSVWSNKNPPGNVPGVLLSALFGEIDPVLMWLNAFFASPLMIPQKIGEAQMTTGELKDREAWIFMLMGILVLIAIICAVIFVR
jgi:hypothetical protein